MKTRFWLVRHGPTHRKAAIGWTDVPVDLSNTAALTRLDAHLPKPAEILSSDLSRAALTADALSEKRTRHPHDQALREIHFGEWEDREFADISAQNPELSKEYWTRPGWAAPPGGESMDTFAARVTTAVQSLAETHAGKDVVIVAHFGVVIAALALATGMPYRSAFGFTIDPLSVTRIDHFPTTNDWSVRGVNHIP